MVEGQAGPGVSVVKLRPTHLTPESFAPFGQVLGAVGDGDAYGPLDAQLDLSRGVPRFYIMRIGDRSLSFDAITHHAKVTQCLGSVGARSWYLGVAAPSIVDPEAAAAAGIRVSRSRHGHVYVPPSPADVQVFKVEGTQFLKLHVGTWHAGPLFTDPTMDFYNLELSDTNVVDHTSHVFSAKDGVVFEIED